MQDMKTVAAFFALSLAAAAQTMVGLPGVELTGTAENPVITNNSGKPIIVYVMTFDLAEEGRHTDDVRFIMDWTGFLPGTQMLADGDRLEGAPAVKSPLGNNRLRIVPIPVVKASLDSVIFGDGSFISRDTTGTFVPVGLGKTLARYRKVGESVANGSKTWDDLDVMRKPGKPSLEEDARTGERWAAEDLLAEKGRSGEAIAHKLAERWSQMADLWKGTTK